MRVINTSEELKERAFYVLNFKEAVNNIVKGLAQEMAKNHMDTIRLWEDVRAEAAKQGVIPAADETINYDGITKRFTVVKK